MAHTVQLNVELVHKMANMLEQKLAAQTAGYDVPTVFLEKEHPASYAEIEIDIEIIGCSENDIYFNCTTELQNRSIIRVNLPAPMYVSVAIAPNGSGINSDYYGVIHGIGEEEKKELRRFINSVFFREKEAARAAELEAFEQAKLDAIARKKEEEEKAAEEARKKEEEEEQAKKEAEAKAEEMKKQQREAKANEEL